MTLQQRALLPVGRPPPPPRDPADSCVLSGWNCDKEESEPPDMRAAIPLPLSDENLQNQSFATSGVPALPETDSCPSHPNSLSYIHDLAHCKKVLAKILLVIADPNIICCLLQLAEVLFYLHEFDKLS